MVQKNFVDDLNRIRFSDQHFIKTNQDLINLFSDIPEALENNYNFTQRFNFKPKKSAPVLPKIDNKKNINIEEEIA